jgi:hypothetical protein
MWSACLQLGSKSCIISAFPHGIVQGPKSHLSFAGLVDRYTGEYQNDVPHGLGSYYFASGHTYEGQWLNGSKSGYCVYSLASGQQWAGDPSIWSIALACVLQCAFECQSEACRMAT